MTRAVVLLLATLGACADYPRDVGDTLERVKASKQFTVALDPRADERGKVLVAELGKAVGARPRLVAVEAGETPLLMVEAGEIDLLLAPLDPKSPWSKRVTIGPMLAELDEALANSTGRLVPVTRNGENAWVDRVHRAAERVRARP